LRAKKVVVVLSFFLSLDRKQSTERLGFLLRDDRKRSQPLLQTLHPIRFRKRDSFRLAFGFVFIHERNMFFAFPFFCIANRLSASAPFYVDAVSHDLSLYLRVVCCYFNNDKKEEDSNSEMVKDGFATYKQNQ